MLKQTLKTLFLCFAAMILTTRIAFSPLPSGVLLAEHTPNHAVESDDRAKSSVAEPDRPLMRSPQIDASESARDKQGDRSTQSENAQPTQADPSVPYDPYDFEMIREMDREIYGEVKGNQERTGDR